MGYHPHQALHHFAEWLQDNKADFLVPLGLKFEQMLCSILFRKFVLYNSVYERKNWHPGTLS